jgi:hypothetical protein
MLTKELILGLYHNNITVYQEDDILLSVDIEPDESSDYYFAAKLLGEDDYWIPPTQADTTGDTLVFDLGGLLDTPGEGLFEVIVVSEEKSVLAQGTLKIKDSIIKLDDLEEENE